ncbi:MAG: hypothetical protein ACXQS8_04000 [Candidatus Helarchaeales archaeon]
MQSHAGIDMRKISGSDKNLVKCPKCGYSFSKMYARMTACGDCPSVALGNCGMIRCPYCHEEFPLDRSRFII